MDHARASSDFDFELINGDDDVISISSSDSSVSDRSKFMKNVHGSYLDT